MTNISIFVHLCALQDILVMERQSNRNFKIIGEVPMWLNQFYPALAAQDELIPGQKFPFLENFLFDAESFWLENKPKPLKSGIWTEVVSGNELHLEASAVCQEQNQILLIETGFEEQQRYLQKARETQLMAEKIFNEVVNEIDSQVIPLKQSITQMQMFHVNMKEVLKSLDSKTSNLNKEREKINNYFEIHEMNLNHLNNFLKFLGIVDTFRAKIKSLVPFDVVLQEAPDVFLCAKEIVKVHPLSTSSLVKRANLQLDRNINQTRNWKVVAEEKELLKVLDYLIRNVVSSFRPPSTVTVGIHDEGNFIITTIGDKGTGIEPEIAPTLFQKLSQGKGKRRTIPHELDFCRIMSERWGGTIGVYARPEGGLVFRFCLPKLVAPR